MPKRKSTIYNKKWKVIRCPTGEKCWYRAIALRSAKTNEYGDYKSKDIVISSAAVDRKMATYIVRLHNNALGERRDATTN